METPIENDAAPPVDVPRLVRPLQTRKWQETHKKFCWNCATEKPLKYWEENTPGDRRERVGDIYAQCADCGCYSKDHNGREKVPSWANDKISHAAESERGQHE